MDPIPYWMAVVACRRYPEGLSRAQTEPVGAAGAAPLIVIRRESGSPGLPGWVPDRLRAQVFQHLGKSLRMGPGLGKRRPHPARRNPHPRLLREALFAHQHRQHGIISQCVMVIEVLVAQGDGVDALDQQLDHPVFYAVGVAVIGEAFRHPRRSSQCAGRSRAATSHLHRN